MVADAQKATKRNAAVARKAAKRPPRPLPLPTAALTADEPADEPAAPAPIEALIEAPLEANGVVEADGWLAELPMVDEERWIPADEVEWADEDVDAEADADDGDVDADDAEVAADDPDEVVDGATDEEVTDDPDPELGAVEGDPAVQPVARRREPLRARPVEPTPARKVMRLRVEQPTIRAQQASGLDGDDAASAAPRPRRRQLRAR
jgi:hypothetical protein